MLTTTLRTSRQDSRNKKEEEIERKLKLINVSEKTREMGEEEKDKETKTVRKQKRKWKGEQQGKERVEGVKREGVERKNGTEEQRKRNQ